MDPGGVQERSGLTAPSLRRRQENRGHSGPETLWSDIVGQQPDARTDSMHALRVGELVGAPRQADLWQYGRQGAEHGAEPVWDTTAQARGSSSACATRRPRLR
jgi:hypothetical protein